MAAPMTKKIIHIYTPEAEYCAYRAEYCAYREGDEKRPWLHGWGKDDEEAVADLKRIEREADEAEEGDTQEEWEDLWS